jgi:hypothetical protein
MRCKICGKRIWWRQEKVTIQEIKPVDEKGIPLDFINPHEFKAHSDCVKRIDMHYL